MFTTMEPNMNDRYRVFRRPWGVYYCEDLQTGKQESLKTRDNRLTDIAFCLSSILETHYTPETARLGLAPSSRS